MVKQASFKTLSDFPSSLSLERFLVTFFEGFIDYIPFIHVPTWHAEEATPTLLLAVVAIGASHYQERKTADALHRAAIDSISFHVCYVNNLVTASF